MKKCFMYLKKMVRKFGIAGLLSLGMYCILLILAMISTPFSIPSYVETTNFIKIVYSEITDMASVIPVALSLLVLLFNNLVMGIKNRNGIILASLISYEITRIAYITKIDSIYLVSINIIMIIVYISLYIHGSRSVVSNDITGDKGYIKKSISCISNENVLAIQLFRCTIFEDKLNGNHLFKLNYVDQLCRSDVDINCITSCTLVLPNKYYSSFNTAKEFYSRLSKVGADDIKEELLTIVEKNIEEIYQRLSNLKEDEIDKVNCCLARLYMCFLQLKDLLNGAQYQIIELPEGKLNISSSIEHELLTRLRTGLLGCILFQDKNYIFKYHKKGSKNNRQYLCSSLDVHGLDDELYICLATVANNDSLENIRGPEYEYITNAFKKIQNKLRKEFKNEKH